jgi:hypothetical protein
MTNKMIFIPRDLSPPARIGSNPARTDVTVWESLQVYLRKVSGLFPNILYNVHGFSLPPIKTVRHHITEKKCWLWRKKINKQTKEQYDFNFFIVNFPYLCSDIQHHLCGVYISWLVGYVRVCSTYDKFLIQSSLLTNKLMLQGFCSLLYRHLSANYCR